MQASYEELNSKKKVISMFRYETIIPKNMINGFKTLSKSNWYKVEKKNNTWSIQPNFKDIKINKDLINTLSKDKKAMTAIYILTESMKIGPKVIEPSFENCIALANTELHIPYDTYQQIYPVVITHIPNKYREYILKELGARLPKYVFSTTYPIILMNMIFDHYNGDLLVSMAPQANLKFLEDHFIESVGENKYDPTSDFAITKLIERIVINLNLILTNYGHKSLGFHKLGGKKHRDETPYELIAPTDQMIKMYETKEYEDKGGTHASPKPHWRKGFWRNQHTLKGIEQRFLKPVFVNAHRAIGDYNQGIYIPR